MIVLFGKPGAGKGTQAKLLVDEKQFVLAGAGELLRQAAQTDKELAVMLRAGKLVGGDVLFPLISTYLERIGHKRIILDGFPRNREQANWLKQQLEKNPPERIDLIILDISDEEVYSRLSRRGRVDDTPTAIQARLKIYQDDVSQAIDLLGESAQVHYVDGAGSIRDVYARVLRVLSEEKA